MPRPRRVNIPGLTYHVTNRGVKKLAVFHDDEDRHQFLRLFLVVRKQFPIIIKDYSLMTNHFHLLLKTLEGSLSDFMQCFTSRYARWFNQKYGNVGHAFQSRFYSIPVETEAYLREVSAYIALNAPRAGLVKRPEDYPWCGYRAAITGVESPFVNANELLRLFSDNADRARVLYQQFVDERFMNSSISHDELLKKLGCD